MSFIKYENGQGMVEYALIIGLIALVLVVLLVAFGGKIKNTFENKTGNGSEIDNVISG